jgi:hypothetical protein
VRGAGRLVFGENSHFKASDKCSIFNGSHRALNVTSNRFGKLPETLEIFTFKELFESVLDQKGVGGKLSEAEDKYVDRSIGTSLVFSGGARLDMLLETLMDNVVDGTFDSRELKILCSKLDRGELDDWGSKHFVLMGAADNDAVELNSKAFESFLGALLAVVTLEQLKVASAGDFEKSWKTYQQKT